MSSIILGNFTNEKDINLITARGNRLVIELVSPEGIKAFKEITIHGKIAVIKLFRYPVSRKKSDFLIEITFKNFCFSITIKIHCS